MMPFMNPLPCFQCACREVEDLNRGRALVRDLAVSHGIICESTVEEGIRTVVRVTKNVDKEKVEREGRTGERERGWRGQA